MNTFENGAEAVTGRPIPDSADGSTPSRKRAISSTVKRVAEAEALLRKRKLKLREEQELAVLCVLAEERLGGEWQAKNRNAIFDALIDNFDQV